MKAVGDYEYGEKDEIGRGAFGKVFKGHIRKKLPGVLETKEKLPEFVAIKEIDVKSQSVTNSPETIRRETEILNKLSIEKHKNIVTLLNCDKQADYAYLVMEFCNGGNLLEYLQKKQKVGETTIRMFLRQIAAGLKVAHDMHIVHRDLKPENILLCFSGSKYPSPDNITLKIADFGVGRFLSPDELANSVCGSLKYMAPEILKRRPYDNKVDMWSVGIISYECFNGLLPKDTLFAFSDGPIDIPSNASQHFSNLLRGLLEKDESERLSTKQFFNHDFLADTISVRVVATGRDTKTIHVKDNQDVDVHLIDVVCSTYSTDSESSYLIHEDGRPLERGSGHSLRESGIVHNNTVALVVKLSGGNDDDLKAAPDKYCSSYVSRLN